MADVAVVFTGWGPSELYAMSVSELMGWRERAARRAGAED